MVVEGDIVENVYFIFIVLVSSSSSFQGGSSVCKRYSAQRKTDLLDNRKSSSSYESAGSGAGLDIGHFGLNGGSSRTR